jgi:subtilisin family serine protease
MKSEKALAVFILIFTVLLLCAGQALAQSEHIPYQTGELLVKYKTHDESIQRSALHSAGLVRSSRPIGRSRIHRVVLKPGTTVEQALKIYANDPNVDVAEPNYLIHAQAMPNDTNFSQQWGLYNTGQAVSGTAGMPGNDMDAPQAWDIITDSTEVIVAILDTGCDTNHLDLAANIWRNPGEIAGDGVDNDRNGYIDDVHGWDFADGNNNPFDASGHGTHVAGITAAVGDNQRGISGVAWHARIMPVRVMNAFDTGTTADAIDAIHYAVENGAKIINCSWGSASYSSALRYAIAESDALFICAAGNSGNDTDGTPYYPASYDSPNIISVAASDQRGQLAWFSNYGTVSTDVAAPGTRIYSLDNSRRTLWSDDFNDVDLDGWTTGGSNDKWEIAAPAGTSIANALATSPDGQNVNDANTWAQLPTQNLATSSATLLTFKHLGSAESNANHLFLEISLDGVNWTNLPLKIGGTVHHSGITGRVPYWTTAMADLGRWDGTPQVYLRLRFHSDALSNGTGFFIDDMRLTVADDIDRYQFMQGTSMAAAFVSGLAALIQSEESSLTPLEIKFIIESSVDLTQNLLNMVRSGGRVNAYNALTLFRELSLNADMSSLDQIQLSWTTDTPLNGPITIQRRMENETDFSSIAQLDSDTGQYMDYDVSFDAAYYYRIQAISQDGDNRYSHQTLAGAVHDSAASSAGGGGGGCFIHVSSNLSSIPSPSTP